MKIYINGKFYEKQDAKISVFDHGLLYGDGVFEGIRSYSRLVFKLREHIDRLFESAHSIMLDVPMTKSQMVRAVVETLKANKLNNAYIRLIVTRGEGDLGLDPRKCRGQATVIIIADNIALYPEKFYKEGLSIITVPELMYQMQTMAAETFAAFETILGMALFYWLLVEVVSKLGRRAEARLTSFMTEKNGALAR